MGKQTAQGKNKQTTGFDAKHRKSKVGKRAIKSANVTDTSFKTASIHIQKQAIEALSDSKEKLLSYLSQTTHHAPAARCVAVKGIRNLINVSEEEGGKLLVTRFLNIILPSISRNLVDEDADVRDVVIPTLNELFHICVTNNIPIKPFLPLHIAYITSALNSLDSYVRRDGVRAVEILANQLPALVKDYISTLLPAYARVLADCRGRSSKTSKNAYDKLGNKANKQQKVKNNRSSSSGGGSFKSSNPERCFALRSLVALLKTANRSDVADLYDKPKYPKGDTTTNHTSIIICRTFTPHTVQLEDSYSIDSSMLPIRVILQLLLNLRDSWVEITQKGEATSSGHILPPSYLEEASLLLSSFQLLYHQYSKPMYTYYKTAQLSSFQFENKNEEKQFKQFTSLVDRLPSILLDNFPLLFPDTNNNVAKVPLQYHSANSLFCLLLSDMGSSSVSKNVIAPSSSTNEDWSTSLLEYLLPRYEKTSFFFQRMAYVQQQPIIHYDIQVMAQLLLKSKHNNNSEPYILNDKDRFELFQTFCNYFLYFENTVQKPSNFFQVIVITSNIIPLLSKVIHEIGSSFGSDKNHILQLLLDSTNGLGNEMHKILLQFPYLFKIMGTDYPKELSILLDLLLYIIRQWDGIYSNNDDEDRISSLMMILYNSMLEIFVDSSSLMSTTTTMEEEENENNNDRIVCLIQNEPWNIPLINNFPYGVKRKIIGILALLKYDA